MWNVKNKNKFADKSRYRHKYIEQTDGFQREFEDKHNSCRGLKGTDLQL